MNNNIIRLGWTAEINGKEIGAHVTLTDWDGDVHHPVYLKTLELLNAQMSRSITKVNNGESVGLGISLGETNAK